jgi:hypothetical protein
MEIEKFIVLQCAQCEIFQVQQKTSRVLAGPQKWICRRCGCKQSAKTVYASSLQAAPLRPIAQELNIKFADKKAAFNSAAMRVDPRRRQDEDAGAESTARADAASAASGYGSHYGEQEERDAAAEEADPWAEFLEPPARQSDSVGGHKRARSTYSERDGSSAVRGGPRQLRRRRKPTQRRPNCGTAAAMQTSHRHVSTSLGGISTQTHSHMHQQ